MSTPQGDPYPIAVKSSHRQIHFTAAGVSRAKQTAASHSRFDGGCRVTVTDDRTGEVLATYQKGHKL